MDTPGFNFVIDCTNSALQEYLKMEPEMGVNVFTRGDLNWCLQTYFILRKHSNLLVQCSNRILPDVINIIHSDQLLQQSGKPENFIVCVRADYPRRRWAHYHLVQNKEQLAANSSFIPHWVQPGIIKRDANRQGLKKVAYAGEAFNGNLAGTTNAWKNLLCPYNIEFENLSAGIWHDLSSIDVLLGVRSFDCQPHNTKPPTKLFGAWHANIPFIGGHDSAFRQVGTPGQDYLVVGTAEEALDAILRLRDDVELYKKLVQNGKKMATLYNEETIAQVWIEVLTGSVLQRYRKWQTRPVLEQLRFNTLLGLGNLEHNFKQMVKGFLGKNKIKEFKLFDLKL
jgi:hypothetical protein